MAEIDVLVGGNQIFFMFTPNLGEMIQFDEHMFQKGWFNHHLVKSCGYLPPSFTPFITCFVFGPILKL